MAAAAHATRQVGQEATQLAATAKGDARRTIDALGKAAVLSGAAILAGFGLAVKGAIALEREMRNVSSISKAVKDDIGGATAKVIDLSRTVPQSATVLAKGLYEIASSGFHAEKGMTILRASAVAASAGLTDTATSAKAITAVLNAYGQGADKAGRVSDVLFQTVNLGVLSFEELATTVGDFVGSAAAAGVPIEHAAAALATMTLSGISASEAGTSLNRVLQSFIDPSEAMIALLKEQGYESGVAAIEALTLKGAMEMVARETGGSIEALVKLFPEIRAARGALAFMAGEGANANRVFGEMTDETLLLGATQRAYNEQAKGLGFQWNLLTNQAAALGLQIGGALIPVLRSVVGFFTSLVQGISDLPGPVQSTLAVLAGLTGVMLTLGGSFLLLAPKIKAAVDLFGTLRNTAPMLARALSMTTLALGGLGIALTVGAFLLARHAEKKAESKRISEAFAQAIKAEKEGVEGATRAAVVNELAQAKLLPTISKVGATLKSVTDTVLGNKDALTALGRELSANADTAEEAQQFQRNFAAAMGGSRDAMGALAGALADGQNRYDENDKAVLALVGRLRDLQDNHTGTAAAAREQEKAEAELGPTTEDTAKAAEEMKQKMNELDQQLGITKEGTEELTDAQKIMGEALADVAGSPMEVYKAALDAKNQKDRESVDKQNEGLKEGEAGWREFKESAQLSLNEYAAALEQRNRDIIDWKTNLVTVAGSAGVDVAFILAQMGAEGVTLTAQMARGTETEVQRMADGLRVHAREGGQNMANELDAATKIHAAIMRTGGKATADSLKDELNKAVPEIEAIAAKYGLKLAEGVNPVIASIGGKQVVITGNYWATRGMGERMFKAEGGIEDHRAQIAKPGDWRIWAEPETGGEAYIPLTPAKRKQSVPILAEVAKRFGFSLSEFAVGGFTRPEDVPRPPTFEPPYGPPLSTAAEGVTEKAYADTVAFMQRNATLTGTGWQAITSYLTRQGVPHTVTSTLRPGAITASGNLSLHALGKAVDMVGDMRRIFNSLANTASSLRELFYDPMGFYIKNGQRVSGAIGGHDDHVHAATFDQGGWLPPGLTLARNNTGIPERVLGPGAGSSIVIHGPLATIAVSTSAKVDERAFEGAVRNAVEPALEKLMGELTDELRGA